MVQKMSGFQQLERINALLEEAEEMTKMKDYFLSGSIESPTKEDQRIAELVNLIKAGAQILREFKSRRSRCRSVFTAQGRKL